MKTLYLTGSPRSGTTFLSSVLWQSPNILMFDELPLWSIIDEPMLKAAIANVASIFSLHMQRNHFDGLASFRAIVDYYQHGPETQVDAASLTAKEQLVARASRWLVQLDHLFAGGCKLAIDEAALREQQFRFNIIKAMAVHFCRSSKGGNAIKFFGIKTPGCQPVSAIMDLIGLSDGFLMLNVFRSPADVILSSLRRRNDTAAGHDDWHIQDAQSAYYEWAQNFYYSYFWAEQSGKSRFDFLPISYESLYDAPAYDYLRQSMSIEFPTPNHFHNIADLDLDLSEADLEFVNGRLQEYGLPARTFLRELYQENVDCSSIMLLEPEIPNDKASISFNEQILPLVIHGFDQAEPDGRWMCGKWALICFSVPDPTTCERMALLMQGFANSKYARNDISFELNGRPLPPISIRPGNLELPVNGDGLYSYEIALQRRRWNKLLIRASHTYPTKSDRRRLVFKIAGIRFD